MYRKIGPPAARSDSQMLSRLVLDRGAGIEANVGASSLVSVLGDGRLVHLPFSTFNDVPGTVINICSTQLILHSILSSILFFLFPS